MRSKLKTEGETSTGSILEGLYEQLIRGPKKDDVHTLDKYFSDWREDSSLKEIKRSEHVRQMNQPRISLASLQSTNYEVPRAVSQYQSQGASQYSSQMVKKMTDTTLQSQQDTKVLKAEPTNLLSGSNDFYICKEEIKYLKKVIDLQNGEIDRLRTLLRKQCAEKQNQPLSSEIVEVKPFGGNKKRSKPIEMLKRRRNKFWA